MGENLSNKPVPGEIERFESTSDENLSETTRGDTLADGSK
jgi:hypothetical protein